MNLLRRYGSAPGNACERLLNLHIIQIYSSIRRIFENSIDLSQFDEDSSLYTMCRSWLRDKPMHASEQNDDGKVDKEKANINYGASDDENGIHFLPAPVPLPKDDTGKVKDLRIASPVPRPSEKFFVASDESEIVPVNVLLAGHQKRWKEVREKCVKAAVANEERYKESSEILHKASRIGHGEVPQDRMA
ncbi:protein lin-37 homolog [Rhipicephalus sanguineus]|uniref:protein lin-37 homolog n=1 Tax=Rhipicephalus sanguineus TaxID=34632 RepID=UPI0020C3C4F3|nr:protein lin-37 homolog [Rhipicephalus sanguineus]